MLTSHNGGCCGTRVLFVCLGTGLQNCNPFFFSTFHFLSSLHSFQVDVGNQIFVPALSHVLMNVETIDEEFCFWSIASFLSKLGTN